MKNITVKTISVTLSLLLCWQSVVWADPGIIHRSDLSPRSMFSLENAASSFTPIASKYMIGKLLAIEADPASRNLHLIRSKVEDVLLALKDDKNIPAELASLLPAAAGDPEDGEFIIDIGRYRIRYFNPRMPSVPKLVPGYMMIGELRLGEYLSRQLLVTPQGSSNLSSGNVARGDPVEIYGAFRDGKYVRGELRPGIKAMLPEMLEYLKISLTRSRLNEDIKRSIRYSLDQMKNASFIEIKPLVIWDEKDRTQPRAWLLGFSTLMVSGTDPDDITGGGYTLLGSHFHNTVALAERALDIIGDDKELMAEYVFHEAACPVVGHAKAREIQEELFRENYKLVGLEEHDPGQKDGELSLIFKQVIWESSGNVLPEELDISGLEEGVEDFKKKDFTGDGPGDATAYYTGYKKWYFAAKRILTINLSRTINNDKLTIIELLHAMDERFNYITAKLVWIWNFEGMWSRAEGIIKGREFDELGDKEKESVKNNAIRIMEFHEAFMESNPSARFLKDDPGVRGAEEMLKRITGRPLLHDQKEKDHEVNVPDEPVVPSVLPSAGKEGVHGEKVPEEQKEEVFDEKMSKEQKEEVASTPKISQSLTGRRGYNWKAMGIMFVLSVGLSMILRFCLPVNIWTLSIAFVLPMALLVYLLASNWSWWKLVSVVVVSAALSYFLPLPWLGLSFAIVTLGYMVFWKRYGNITRAGIKSPAGEKKTGMPATVQNKSTREEERKEENGEKKEVGERGEKPSYDIEELSEVRLASTVLRYILDILVVVNPVVRDAKNTTDGRVKIDTRKILTAFFIGRQGERIRADKALKNTLRSIVNKELHKIEHGFDLQLRSQTEKLRQWREYDSLSLAGAFNDITQEVVSSVTTGYSGDSGQQEMLAAQELISEYFRITGAFALELRLRVMLDVFREKIASDMLLRRASPKDHYLLGMLEFRFGNDREALSSFREAVSSDPANAEYLLSLGIMEHYMSDIVRASKAYTFSLKLREAEDNTDEAGELKKGLLKVLIDMVGKDIGLDGNRMKTHDRRSESRGMGAIDMLRRASAPELSYEEYAVKIAPKLEETLFTFIPFVLLAAGASAGAVSLRTMVLVMAVSYSVFTGLHIANPSQADPSVSSFGETLRAAAIKMTAPVKIAAFNLIMASFFGGVAVAVNEQLPVFSFFYSMILAGILSIVTYRFHDRVAHKNGIFPDDPERIELSELKQKVKDIISDVPVVEVPYNASTHVLLALKQIKGAWRGKQYRYAFVYFFNLVLFMRTPNTQHVISDDGGLREILIFSGGWTLGALFAPLSVTSIVVLLFFGSVPFYVSCVATAAAVPFVVDMIMYPFYKGTAESHEWLHAYQFKLIEKSRREGKIRDAGDFIEKNMMALEMIWMYDHKPLNGGALKEVRQHIGALIEGGKKGSLGDDRPSVVPEDDPMKDIKLDTGSMRLPDIIDEKAISRDGETDEENIGAEDRYRKTLMRRRIMKSGEYTVPELVNTLISSSMKNEKTILVMDMGLGEGEVNRMLRELVRVFSVIEDNNEELKEFLWNFEVIKGEGVSLARRVTNLSASERGRLSPENIVVITTDRNMPLYQSIEGRAFVAGVDDAAFPETAWLPLIEITLFAIGKHLGWSEEKLRETYAKIPNVVPLEDLSEDDVMGLFAKGERSIVIRLIPNAEIFEKEELREIMDGVRTMLARA